MFPYGWDKSPQFKRHEEKTALCIVEVCVLIAKNQWNSYGLPETNPQKAGHAEKR